MIEKTTKQATRPTGMPGFTVVWGGQVVSLLGSGMTWFALTIWAWELTGQATALALVAFFHFGPTILLSPVAGALVDRWDRKLVMMLSDLAAGLMSVIVLLLYATGNLQIWHLYMTGAFAGAFQAFQFPAYSAAVTTMLPKKQYARANGMLSLAESASGVFAPLAGGILLSIIGIVGILVIDVVTFLVAIGALLLVHIPQPRTTESGREGRGSLWKESLYGFQYILERPSLLGLQLVFLASNLTASFSFTVLAPMILAQTSNNEIMLGTVQSILGIGGVVGGLLMSVWGGPKHRIHGVLLGMTFSSLLGELVLGLGSNPITWGVGAFFSSFFIPFINGSNQAIWQAKVAPDVQGRVFAARRLIAQLSWPIATLLAGPMADYIFEPAMTAGGSLSGPFGGLVGTGPGAGMSLMFVTTGILGVVVGLGGYAIPVVRDAEEILPDHDAVPDPATVGTV
jgi:DHA3 family macrolide efflux protein-like MFS transporter